MILACLPAPSSCGGGGDGGPGAAFCREYAAAECRKIYACPDPTVTVSGTEAACAAAFARLCIDPPSGTLSGDVNCSGGKQVDAAARASCLDSLSSVTCDGYNSPTYSNVCAQVCVTPTSSGTGGSGAGPASPDVLSFCRNLNTVACNRAFACYTAAEQDAAFVENFGSSVAACKAERDSICGLLPALCVGYSATAGDSCVMQTSALSCAQFKAEETPAECPAACPS